MKYIVCQKVINACETTEQRSDVERTEDQEWDICCSRMAKKSTDEGTFKHGPQEGTARSLVSTWEKSGPG